VGSEMAKISGKPGFRTKSEAAPREEIMREIEIFEFRANCVFWLEEVSKTGTAFRVTRHGKPLVDVIPAVAEEKRSWIGSMTGTLKITGDIISPVILSD
jgi:antitoxin (DNA-binding transcriptional repressor) of toxin-antitoxin stability system